MSSEVRLARLRTRWSAVGAAVAITLGAGGVGLANASIGSGEKPVTITIEAERILDTRVNLGLNGAFASDTPRDLQVTGSVPVASGGNKVVVPDGAAGVIVNVTAVNPSADGFLSLRPKGAAGSPTTSTVNFGPGGVEPNSATVDLSADGGIQIWAFVLGGATSVDVLVDVVGYTIDHHHDDRYYTETEVDAQHAALANSAQLVRRTNFFNLPSSTSTDVLTLSLAPGTYFLEAGGLVNSNSASDGQSVSCALTAGSATAQRNGIALFGPGGIGDREDISMRLVVTVASTTDAVFSCSTSGSWAGNIGFAELAAISVQSGSLSAPTGAPLATTTGED